MISKTTLVVAILLLTGFFSLKLRAQTWNGEIQLQTGFSSNKAVPFWLRSNQHGSTPVEGFSGIVNAQLQRAYRNTDSVIWKPDFSTSFRGRINVGGKSELQLIEAKASIKYGFLEFVAGREKEYSGLVDSTLSTGSFSLSGNSLGIPKIEIRAPQYISVPFTNNLLAVKGNFLVGAMGKVPIHYGENQGNDVNAYYHHLSVYGRLGRPSWKMKFEGAINHDVVWGSDKYIFGDQYDLNSLEAFWYVVTGKGYKGAEDYEGRLDISKIGNHLGSLDLAVSYDFEDVQLKFYHQFFYDKGALRYFANIRDGLTGLRFENKKHSTAAFRWEKVLLEYFNSKDQGGQFGAPWTPSGPEYYYNHGVYNHGYSYKGKGVGSPLIVPKKDTREGMAHNPKDFFISTRVSAFHIGFEGVIANWNTRAKLTYAKHYGDFHTSGPNEQWFNGQQIAQDFSYGHFRPVDQLSYYVAGSKAIRDKMDFSVVIAGDNGQLFLNSLGAYIGVSKKF